MTRHICTEYRDHEHNQLIFFIIHILKKIKRDSASDFGNVEMQNRLQLLNKSESFKSLSKSKTALCRIFM